RPSPELRCAITLNNQLKLTRCPHSLAATLTALPSMSLIPFALFSTLPRLPRHRRILRPKIGCLGRTPLSRDQEPIPLDTSVALIIAETLSPSLRFIRSTEPVVIIDVTFPAA